MSENNFEVGGTYENEKGVYEVLSLDANHNKMVIKWGDGKEFDTSIKLQWRILERRRIEKEMLEAKNNPKSRKTARRTRFDGFLDTDFSGGVSGTTWRTQKSLGGATTALLNSDDPQLKSRAVSRMPEVHWIDVNRTSGNKNALPAKLFVKLDTENLYYGFYIERPKAKDQTEGDWFNFIDWLSDAKNETWLKEIADEYELRIYDRKEKSKPFEGSLKVGDGQWHIGAEEEKKPVESLAGFLKELPYTNRVDLYIAKTTAKTDTLARSAQITQDIASLFDILLPLYRASAVSMKE